MASFGELLANSSLPTREALALMQAASGKPKEWLIAHDRDEIDPQASLLFKQLVSRRQTGEPIAYLVGWREFYGRTFWVNRHTLIPRMDTELLVDIALGQLKNVKLCAGEKLQLCELGTGSGCIAISIALEVKQPIHVLATDQSEKALQMARNNAAWLGVGGQISFAQGSWWQALSQKPECQALRFDGIVSNPPYVRPHDEHLAQGDLRFEPTRALVGAGQDGLADIRAIAQGAAARLKPHGFLAVEHGFDQQEAVQAIFGQAGFADIQGMADATGNPRAVMGLLAPRAQG